MIREIIENFIDPKKELDIKHRKEWELAKDLMLPLRPTFFKDFEKKIDEAYHVTDEKGLKGIKSIEGSKKTLATFTKGSVGISYGARKRSKYICVLEGLSSFQSDVDMGTYLSRNGYRWLSPYNAQDHDLVIHNEFSVPMKKILKNKFGEDVFKKIEQFSGKEKQEFMKFYFDESKKLITKSFIKKLAQSFENGHPGMYTNDEVLLHDIKIKTVHPISNEFNMEVALEGDELVKLQLYQRFKMIDKMGFKHNSKFIFREDIANLDVKNGKTVDKFLVDYKKEFKPS